MKDMRIGIGYDVHRMAPERDLMLCTCHIPNETGLDGHSDADAPVHALIDALLGAAALGDVGTLFPDTDPRWKGADSMGLLRRAAALLRENGWRPANADITIFAEEPKISPRAPEMRANLATALGIGAGAVSVKAKTMEGLGPVGAREAIAAEAAVLLESCN